jgi:hypothetical protein
MWNENHPHIPSSITGEAGRPTANQPNLKPYSINPQVCFNWSTSVVYWPGGGYIYADRKSALFVRARLDTLGHFLHGRNRGSGDMTESTVSSSHVSFHSSTLKAASSGGLEAMLTSKIEKGGEETS